MSKPINVDKVIAHESYLTGKFRFRTSWSGKLILQIEYTYTDYVGDSSTQRTNWRDAKVEDLTLLEPK